MSIRQQSKTQENYLLFNCHPKYKCTSGTLHYIQWNWVTSWEKITTVYGIQLKFESVHEWVKVRTTEGIARVGKVFKIRKFSVDRKALILLQNNCLDSVSGTAEAEKAALARCIFSDFLPLKWPCRLVWSLGADSVFALILARVSLF